MKRKRFITVNRPVNLMSNESYTQAVKVKRIVSFRDNYITVKGMGEFRIKETVSEVYQLINAL